LRLLISQTSDSDLQGQIGLLEEAFRASLNQAVRQEINTLKRRGVKGIDLLDVQGRIYQRHNQQET
jgi:hypothetical protein